jgi:Short C-terminal domain
MQRFSGSRRHRVDLLVRPPCRARDLGWDDSVVDSTEQLRELADLLSRGLLTQDEFERQKARVLAL